jgi:hypothetical protein
MENNEIIKENSSPPSFPSGTSREINGEREFGGGFLLWCLQR